MFNSHVLFFNRPLLTQLMVLYLFSVNSFAFAQEPSQNQVRYNYDSMGRLITVERSGYSTHFTYDSVGNQLTEHQFQVNQRNFSSTSCIMVQQN